MTLILYCNIINNIYSFDLKQYQIICKNFDELELNYLQQLR